jgi:hypothetical protein
MRDIKKIMLSCFLGLFVVFVQAQDSVYYYYQGEKIYLQKESNAKVICFDNQTAEQNRTLLSQLKSQTIKVDTLNSLFISD